MSQNSSCFQFVQMSMYSRRSLEQLLEGCAKEPIQFGELRKSFVSSPNIVAFRSKAISEDGVGFFLMQNRLTLNYAPFRTPTGTKVYVER